MATIEDLEKRMFHLEKTVNKLEVQQAHFIAHLESEQGHYNRHYTELNSSIAALESLIRGNGVVGLVARLDRIEQKEKFRAKIEVGALLALIGIGIERIWDLIKGA